MYLIHQEKSKARELLAASQSVAMDSSQMMLADPVILVRKWVGEVWYDSASNVNFILGFSSNRFNYIEISML